MHAFSLKCFGVGDGWASADRNHSAFLYRFPGACVLMDCGEPISRSFKGTGLPYDLLDHVFISHLHFDHVGGFFMFIQSLWLEGRKRPLPVHAPADGLEPLHEMLKAGCIFDDLLPFQLLFQPLVPRRSIQAGALRVTPYPTTHLAHLQKRFEAKYPQAFAAFCFLLESGNVRIVHSADIGAAEDLAPLLQRPVQLLVCELAHVQPEELFAFLRGREIERICFIHLSRDCRQRLDEVQRLAKEILGSVRITFPSDGDEIEA